MKNKHTCPQRAKPTEDASLVRNADARVVAINDVGGRNGHDSGLYDVVEAASPVGSFTFNELDRESVEFRYYIDGVLD